LKPIFTIFGLLGKIAQKVEKLTLQLEEEETRFQKLYVAKIWIALMTRIPNMTRK